MSFGLPCALAAFSYSVNSVLMIVAMSFRSCASPPPSSLAMFCVWIWVPVERNRRAASIWAGVFLGTWGSAAGGFTTGVFTPAVFPAAAARALSRALALAKTRFQSESLTILPIEALVGLFQLPPILSFHCAFVV